MFVEIGDGAVFLLWAFLLLHKGRAQQNGPQARSKEEEKRVPQTPLREHPINPRSSPRSHCGQRAKGPGQMVLPLRQMSRDILDVPMQ